nr:transposase [Candidatus Sigynarchaeota archaeon]
MEIDRAFKIRLYPTADQAALLAKTFGCKRFIWNAMLAERMAWYRDHGKSIGNQRKTEKEWKVSFPFLKVVDAIALQQARIDLDRAYDNFFTGRARFPLFKSRKGKQSYRTINVNDNVKIDFHRRNLTLPKVGPVAYRDNRAFTERVRSVTVSRTKTGRFFASILVKQECKVEPLAALQENKIAAFDMSSRDFLVGEHGRCENPRCYRSAEPRLVRLHRRVSRKVKGSSNRDKARVRLARIYEKIGHRRTDWLQKISTTLANEHDAIIIEALNVAGMKRWNGGIAKSVTLDFSWGAFVRMLGYKMAWRGKQLVTIDRFFPSSKMCSACDAVNSTLTLADRHWTCPSCGATHDQDVNAATNIKREGLR